MTVTTTHEYEWEIENFTCWNAEIHGDVIECGSVFAQLYPHGVGGKGECLKLRLYHGGYSDVYALTAIASNGSVIWKPKKANEKDRFWTFPRGPRFSEVVARIKEKKHKDTLILRWTAVDCIGENYYYCYYRSIICVYDASVELDSRFFRDLKIQDWQYLSVVHSPSSFEYRVSVSACKSDTGLPKFKLKLSATSGERKLVVRTTFTIPTAEGNTKIFEKDFLLVGNEEREFIFLQPDTNEKIFLAFKLINGNSEWFFSSSQYVRTVEITNPGSSKSNENIVSGGNPSALVSDHVGNAVTVLTQEFACLYQDHDFSDFELRCGSVSFPTHRNILCARSPVFKAMLSGDMREAASGRVDVEDLDPHTLGRFLTFLYSGATGGEALGWEVAIKLYYAADKYQVPSLKEECLHVLCPSVSLENVCDILSLADRHQDEKLTSVARNYILKNYNEVLGSEKWEELIKSDPTLAVRTVTHFAKANYAFKNI